MSSQAGDVTEIGESQVGKVQVGRRLRCILAIAELPRRTSRDATTEQFGGGDVFYFRAEAQ